ncbi:MAG TPA: hypothetical protein VFF40_02675 [Acidimicrobiia bacterium]|nr:hypothetical protein [Acidimicrobiia bacterium]
MSESDTTTTTASPTRTRHVSFGRRALVAVLMVIGVILAPLVVVATWTRNQILDTSRYVENIGSLASDPAIIDAAAAQATDALFESVNVEKLIDEALPESADLLVSPLTDVIQGFTEDAARRALETDAFQKIWNEANRIAHAQIEKALTGDGDVISTKNGMIVLDLSPIVDQIRDFLSDQGVTFFDDVSADDLDLRFELFDARALGQTQEIVNLLDTMTYVLPIVMAACFGVALWLSPNRRRSVIRGGIGVAIAAAVVAVGVTVGRSFYLDSVSGPGLPRDALAATWDILVRYLRGGLRALIAVGLLVALGTWVTGPGRMPVRLRTTFRRIIGGATDQADARGLELGRFGQFVGRYRTILQIAGVALGALYLLLVDRVSAGELVWTVVVVLVYLAIVEFLARVARLETR